MRSLNQTETTDGNKVYSCSTVLEGFQSVRAGEGDMMGQLPGGGPYKFIHTVMDWWPLSTRQAPFPKASSAAMGEGGDKHSPHEFREDMFTT